MGAMVFCSLNKWLCHHHHQFQDFDWTEVAMHIWQEVNAKYRVGGWRNEVGQGICQQFLLSDPVLVNVRAFMLS